MKSLEALILLEETYLKTKNQEVNKIISQYTGYIKKELKALEIIKNKNVDIKGLQNCKTVDEYNLKYATYERAIKCRNLGTSFCNRNYSMNGKGWIGCAKTTLTKNEFNLLKEVLGDE